MIFGWIIEARNERSEVLVEAVFVEVKRARVQWFWRLVTLVDFITHIVYGSIYSVILGLVPFCWRSQSGRLPRISVLLVSLIRLLTILSLRLRVIAWRDVFHESNAPLVISIAHRSLGIVRLPKMSILEVPIQAPFSQVNVRCCLILAEIRHTFTGSQTTSILKRRSCRRWDSIVERISIPIRVQLRILILKLAAVCWHLNWEAHQSIELCLIWLSVLFLQLLLAAQANLVRVMLRLGWIALVVDCLRINWCSCWDFFLLLPLLLEDLVWQLALLNWIGGQWVCWLCISLSLDRSQDTLPSIGYRAFVVLLDYHGLSRRGIALQVHQRCQYLVLAPRDIRIKCAGLRRCKIVPRIEHLLPAAVLLRLVLGQLRDELEVLLLPRHRAVGKSVSNGVALVLLVWCAADCLL